MSRLADAAYEWLRSNAPHRQVPSRELWEGLKSTHPELTASSEHRKTPYNTLMRDMRLDATGRFTVGGGFIGLSWSRPKAEDH
jgi:hypothetical protein